MGKHMTREQFEREYAASSGVTVEFLHANGRYGSRCDCGDPSCKGWQMSRRNDGHSPAHVEFEETPEGTIREKPGKLPAEFVSEHMKAAAGTKICGIPVEELTREELLAAIGVMQVQAQVEKRLREQLGRFDQMSSIPRWRTEDIDAHVQEKVLRYEQALASLEGEIRKLRDENAQLKRRLDTRPKHFMRPQVISFMGFQMESADIDG